MSPRPHLRRRVRGRPGSNYFKPAGVPLRDLEESVLSLAEFEAMRLIDSEGLSQTQAGEQMHISQSTLSRTLDSARKKLADAVVNGKGIRIENKMVEKEDTILYTCSNCHYQHSSPTASPSAQIHCPECGRLLVQNK